MEAQVQMAVDAVRQKYNVKARAFTRRDFYRICKGEGIEVHQVSEATFMMRVFGVHWICLSRRDRGPRRTFAAFHELGHFFLNHHDGEPGEYKELEADYFAALAIAGEPYKSNVN